MSLNDAGNDYATLAAEGIGVCEIRLALLAMWLRKRLAVMRADELDGECHRRIGTCSR